MAKKIQAWATYGPRLEPATRMDSEELIRNIIQATNQSRGSVLAVLAELDVQLENGVNIRPRVYQGFAARLYHMFAPRVYQGFSAGVYQ